MKFAKELEQDLVPEWRIKYLNYKAGKKYVKGVARAIHRANATPKTPGRRNDHPPPNNTPSFFRSPFFRQQGPPREDADLLASSPAPLGRTPRSEPANIPAPSESRSLNNPSGNGPNYGSFVRTPPPSSRLSRADSHQTRLRSIEDPLGQPSSRYRKRPLSHDRGPYLTLRLVLEHCAAYSPKTNSRKRTGGTNAMYPLQAIDTVRQREVEFFDFLDSELDKVESFYRQKEVQAELRLNALREQLHEMRDRRTQEMAERRRLKEQRIDGIDNPIGESSGVNGHHKWIDPIKSKLFRPGANSKALARMAQTPVVGAMSGDASRDYIRRPQEHGVPYRTAKRKLKLALQEFYRGLELLKSYALLNRTAFRKLNKKYDKAVNARPPYRYMNEKVNKSWFVNSEVIDGQIRAVEDLYARYFENGNHKIAAGKLRRVNRRPSDESSIAFWNGLSIGVGAVFTIQGLVYGAELLSRQWLAYSHFRLFFAGLYPVEFRDFFLGDIYCSLTYATSNVELFFCLYANYWENPPICNSGHSRLLGFFSTLPAIWRALQCIRRYYDTKNVFPHLVNCGKYIMTILSYVTLSLYRIHNTRTNLALFITFSTLNGVYTSIWDLFMDFSLLQPDARHPFLRDILGLKRRWLYYTIMVIDPILRFGWIFYAIFTHDIQHSTIVSILVSLSEVVRRGMWALLRVENEHCSNVAQYKASRDVPLPYDISREPLMERMSSDEVSEGPDDRPSNTDIGRTSSQDAGHPDGQASAHASIPIEEAGLRRRRKSDSRAARSIRGIMANAHRQDFEKKRPAVEVDDDLGAGSADELQSEEEDDDDTGSISQERLEIRGMETLVRGEENRHK
ncbi:hypothetical protein NUW58_g4265 [Xylaria curta]|uniref:Uncharacterized protein n=1 Tax=Xylaria curta TaxID=42375 RepID=A0ACC1P8J6_9PEZI|nr:hypothetical protein NUW58_g4265 [Xylaria curta]